MEAQSKTFSVKQKKLSNIELKDAEKLLLHLCSCFKRDRKHNNTLMPHPYLPNLEIPKWYWVEREKFLHYYNKIRQSYGLKNLTDVEYDNIEKTLTDFKIRTYYYNMLEKLLERLQADFIKENNNDSL